MAGPICRIAFFLSLLTALHAQEPVYDIWISGGRIIDGAGNPWYRGDVGIQGDVVSYVGPPKKVQARFVLDASGKVVTPGFIDTHSHGRRGVFEVPSAENQIRQGVTTIIEGPDGSSPFPVGDYLARFSKVPATTNFGLMVGQGTIREKVIGLQDRKATPEELDKMRELVRQAMAEGAFGLSTGLFYVPGAFTPTEEVIALARVAGEWGGIYTSHMRNESSEIVASVQELIRIGEEGKLPAQVTHHKVMSGKNWGKSVETLRLVEEARKRGVDISIDQYPYTASSTGLAALVPKWALESGQKSFKERAAAPESRARMKVEIAKNLKEDRGSGDLRNVVFASCAADRSLAGKNLRDVTGSDDFEKAAEHVVRLQEAGGCSCIYHSISEDDVVRIMQYPGTMIASDGGIPVFGVDVPHPRNYGTFARVLGRYVREKHVLTLEDAVRRMTSLPASRFRIPDRGLLRPGMKADVAVFDAERVIDKSEFGNPHQYSEGFVHVLVNGTPVLVNGQMQAARPGRALYGPGRGR
ncbi:MAG TPA: D-aminoacylase [Bryobacteraceae bacterium]|nr:D-aminoacylase [Bryobacteraceae bacterium]